MKKPFYKTWWFAAVMAILVLFILGTIGSIFEEDKPKEELVEETSEEDETQEKTEKEAQDEEETKALQDEKQETEEVEDKEVNPTEEDVEVVDEGNNSEWTDLKGEIIGKSDKDFKTLTNSNPSALTSDTGENWRIITISESIPIEEYGLSYDKEYMNEKEIHFILNSSDNTTTVINKQGGLIFLDIKEYVEKEEEDAKILGSGSILSKYIIYPDGDIEKTE